MKTTMESKNQARADLMKYFNDPPGDAREAGKYFTVYTILKHVSKSGMMRVIDVYIIRNNEPLRLSWSVAELIGATYDRKHEGVKVGGCGMDMGFHIVNNLSMALFCPGKYEHDAAYKLNHRWIG
jgi:hypothetical protein